MSDQCDLVQSRPARSVLWQEAATSPGGTSSIAWTSAISAMPTSPRARHLRSPQPLFGCRCTGGAAFGTPLTFFAMQRNQSLGIPAADVRPVSANLTHLGDCETRFVRNAVKRPCAVETAASVDLGRRSARRSDIHADAPGGPLSTRPSARALSQFATAFSNRCQPSCAPVHLSAAPVSPLERQTAGCPRARAPQWTDKWRARARCHLDFIILR